uniref:Uncharacterized protein n=1 Tax=Araucaria cunninghamii TaxID=56994 RepID=A0A0D6R7N7_ARACU
MFVTHIYITDSTLSPNMIVALAFCWVRARRAYVAVLSYYLCSSLRGSYFLCVFLERSLIFNLQIDEFVATENQLYRPRFRSQVSRLGGVSMNNTRINKIRQIVHLRQIMRKWHARALRRKVSTVNECALSPRFGGGSSLSYDSDEECCRRPASPPPDVPEGYLAVYVGSEERRRFIIPTSYLSLPVFRTLLDKAEEEFGFDHKGGLTIPCEIAVFEDVLRVLATNDDHHGGEEILHNINVCKPQEPHVYSTPLQEKSFG